MPEQPTDKSHADTMSFDEIATALGLPRYDDGRILPNCEQTLRRIFERADKFFTRPHPCRQIDGNWFIPREHLPRVRAALSWRSTSMWDADRRFSRR
jgi:hypothetical protein